MKRLVLRIAVNVFAIYLASMIIPAVVINSVGAGLLAGAVLTLLNTFVRPLLLLITLPVNLITLGLFTLTVNAWMLMLTTSLVGGLVIPGFWLALLASLPVALVNLLLNHWFRRTRSRLISAPRLRSRQAWLSNNERYEEVIR